MLALQLESMSNLASPAGAKGRLDRGRWHHAGSRQRCACIAVHLTSQDLQWRRCRLWVGISICGGTLACRVARSCAAEGERPCSCRRRLQLAPSALRHWCCAAPAGAACRSGGAPALSSQRTAPPLLLLQALACVLRWLCWSCLPLWPSPDLGFQRIAPTLFAAAGIGVCAALALLELPASEALPPLECLLTIDEETGLTGALPFRCSSFLRN